MYVLASYELYLVKLCQNNIGTPLAHDEVVWK